MSCRKWRVRTVPLSQISKANMMATTVIIGTCGTLFALLLTTHDVTSGISCFVATWLAMALRWLAWASHQ